MSILHTKFLVHWTGKDFHMPPTSDLDDDIKNLYVERLLDVLKNGFFMNKPNEKLERIHSVEGEYLQGSISRTCFTEIKLSMAKKHSSQYGGLGIGVDRQFVIKRYGNPVFYVNNGEFSNIMTCAKKVFDYVENKPNIKKEFSTMYSFFKRMGNRYSEELPYYEELEWRIAHLKRLDDAGLVTVQDSSEFIYRVKLNKKDVKVIVFPDNETKEIALSNQDILDNIDKPICVTIDDCLHF